MKLPLKEPITSRYLYLSVDNLLHVFMPAVSGVSIGLDNTCKAVYGLQEFFDKGTNSNKKVSLKKELLIYKAALVFDLSMLDKSALLTQQKETRLKQIEAYLAVLGYVDKHPELSCLGSGFPSYPRPLEGMMQNPDTSNLYSMLLRPRLQDSFLRGHRRIFSVNRNTDSLLYESLQEVYQEIDFSKTKTAKTRLRDAVLASVEAKAKDFAGIANVLTTEVKKQFDIDIDTSKNNQGAPLTKTAVLALMEIDETEAEASDYVDGILGSCAKKLFDNLLESPFYLIKNTNTPSSEGRREQVENLSIITQFFLGQTNIYCVANKIGSSDWGVKFDASPQLCQALAQLVVGIRNAEGQIEDAILDFINTHHTPLGLSRQLNTSDVAAIITQFKTNYHQIKESPHFDEFFILDTQNKGDFVTHQGSIGVNFARFVSSNLFDVPQELIQPLNQALQQAAQLGPTIPHKNDLLVNNKVDINTANLDANALQALYERIDSYSDLKLKETLYEQLKQERPDFKPKVNPKTFLQHVAYGQQKEAEALLEKDTALAQELLTAKDREFTDYSGRTFKCTAYEYAWWAKDSHMRFMLEKYMDNDTKQTLLKRVEDIEGVKRTGEFFKQPRGLVYKQNGKKHHSIHFDFSGLKQALQAYIDAYNQSPRESEEDWEILDALWIKVGLAQREVPAHVAQEYCHPRRSFDAVKNNPKLLDAVNPANLERSVKFFNYGTRKQDVWFTPNAIIEASGLGASFAVLRGGFIARSGIMQVTGDESVVIDLLAVKAIEKVRTDDLKRSLANLAASSCPCPLTVH